jgi:hypothetical protein
LGGVLLGLIMWQFKKTRNGRRNQNFFEYIKPYGIIEFVRSGPNSRQQNSKGLVEYLPNDMGREMILAFG